MFHTTSLRSRGAFLRPGFDFLASLTRMRGWAEHRETYRVLLPAPGGRAQRSTPGACEAPCVPCARDARLSALHRGDFGLRSRASFSGICSGSAPRSQVLVPGGRGPGPPGASGYQPRAAGRHSSPVFWWSLQKTPLKSEDGRVHRLIAMCSQAQNERNSLPRCGYEKALYCNGLAAAAPAPEPSPSRTTTYQTKRIFVRIFKANLRANLHRPDRPGRAKREHGEAGSLPLAHAGRAMNVMRALL